METFADAREFVENPRYQRDREVVLEKLALENIDGPIRNIVAGFAELPYCFSLQSCYGHFVHAAQPQLDNLEPLPSHDVGTVQYRIAYMALCLENSREGRHLRRALEQIPASDPEYVQFGSPEWFWQRHLNSFALQVEPSRFADRDVAILGHEEALYVQEVRDRFFTRLTELVQVLQEEFGAV
jgi:hypothetical protein